MKQLYPIDAYPQRLPYRHASRGTIIRIHDSWSDCPKPPNNRRAFSLERRVNRLTFFALIHTFHTSHLLHHLIPSSPLSVLTSIHPFVLYTTLPVAKLIIRPRHIFRHNQLDPRSNTKKSRRGFSLSAKDFIPMATSNARLPQQQQQQFSHLGGHSTIPSGPVRIRSYSQSQSQSQSQGQSHNQSQNQNQSQNNDENNFRRPLLGTLESSSHAMSVKRKLSKGDMNPNKVHRRVSGSFSDIANTLSNEVNSMDNDTYATETNQKPTRDESLKAAEIPTLILAPFHPAPWVEFGSVIVGTKKQVAAMIENPSDQTERLSLDSNCRMGDKGFTITQLDPLLVGPGSTHLVIPPNSTVEISISWTPLSAGSTRAIAILKTNSTRPTINLRGRGDFPVR